MRVKRGTQKNRRHKAVLEQTKGFRMSYSKLYRRAKEALLHAGEYNFAHRKKRQSQFRKIWITRINAVTRQHGISYSKFINILKQQNVKLDRKMMSFMIENHKPAFVQLIESVTK